MIAAMDRPTQLPETPLSLCLKHKGITHGELARMLSVSQSTVTRMVNKCAGSVDLARRIVAEIDPKRTMIHEGWILLAREVPEVFGWWAPPPVVTFPAGGQAGSRPDNAKLVPDLAANPVGHS